MYLVRTRRRARVPDCASAHLCLYIEEYVRTRARARHRRAGECIALRVRESFCACVCLRGRTQRVHARMDKAHGNLIKPFVICCLIPARFDVVS